MPHRILIVDDEDTLLFATQTYLQTCGYRVDCARDLREATAALATDHYDVVITDLCLDGARDTGGLAIISYVREHYPATRVILWTAFLSPTVEQVARQRGADVFLQKSIPLPEVEEVVCSLLGGEEAVAASAAPSPLAEPSAFTILVVDDQEEALVSTRLLLEMEGYHVLTAAGGNEALALFQPGRTHLVIVDYFMPGMNGETVVREIRKRDIDVQILLQTGYSGEKPPREMLRLLDIQGYHDKLDGPDRLLLWVEVALKAATQLGAIRAAEQEVTASRAQLRRLAARLFRAQEEERAQISRELHDHLGQLHAAIGMNAEWVQHHCPPDLSALQEPLQETVRLAREAQHVVRALCTLLRPGELSKLGLAAALQEYVTDFTRRSSIPIEFSCDGGDLNTLPVEMATTIYRIVQEALTNVVRHAAATGITVTVHRRGKMLEVSVVDNGKGFVVALSVATPGLGLVGMQERARLIGGTVRVHSAPGTGTAVTLNAPLAN